MLTLDAVVAVVAVAALPLMLIPHVPEAPPPVVVAYELVSSVQVSVAVFFKNPLVPVNAAMAVRSASRGWPLVIPYPASEVGVPVIDDHAGVMFTEEAAVMRPLASTVKVATCVAEPYDVAVTPVLERVAVPVALAEPSKDVDHATSPVELMVLAVARAVADEAVPLSGPEKLLAVMTLALKLPEPSRSTTVLTTFVAEELSETVNVLLPA